MFLKCNDSGITSSSKYNITNFNNTSTNGQNFILYNEYTKMPAFTITILGITYINSYINAHSKIDDLTIKGTETKEDGSEKFDNYFNFLEIPFYNHQMMYFFQIFKNYYLLRPKYIYF